MNKVEQLVGLARQTAEVSFMPRRYRTVDVFTRTMFGGNPLAVVLDADGLDDSQMQAIAKEFNYSETSFVRRPLSPRHAAEVRIFTPSTEVPFAGHPNVGTAYVLASLDETPAHTSEFVFEEKAGLVRVELIRVAGVVRGAQLTAPQPLTTGSVFDQGAVAACLGVSEADIEISRHRPLIASIGLPFLVAELGSRAALQRATANPTAFEKILPAQGADAIYIYTRDIADRDGVVNFTARMFAPSDGLAEDPATGSATGAAVALNSTLTTVNDGISKFTVAQGVDMGRPSLLEVEVDIAQGMARAVRVGGACVSVMSGIIEM
jgi:trans-2,3-dihydro-3-hydroxyanthranilate isomerase